MWIGNRLKANKFLRKITLLFITSNILLILQPCNTKKLWQFIIVIWEHFMLVNSDFKEG